VSAISTSHPSSHAARAPDTVAPVFPARAGAARWIVLCVGVAIVLGAGWWITNSPVFDLGSLQVRGNAHVTSADVRRLSGLSSSTNVLWFHPGPAERRLEANPWILEARISRDLPSGLTVTIEERVPVAVTGGRHPMLVAADGMVLAPAGQDSALPVVKTTGRPSVGDRLPTSEALVVVRSFSPQLLPLVASVSGGSPEPLVVTLRDGVQAVYGTASEAVSKSRNLQAVLSWATRHGVRPGSVDLQAPSAPALRPFASPRQPPSSQTAASGG